MVSAQFNDNYEYINPYALDKDKYYEFAVNSIGDPIAIFQKDESYDTIDNLYIDKNDIFYTTIYDYFTYLDIKKITRENITEKINIEYEIFMNANIRVYWPDVSLDDIDTKKIEISNEESI